MGDSRRRDSREGGHSGVSGAGAGPVAQLVECPPSTCETLGLTPSITTKTNKDLQPGFGHCRGKAEREGAELVSWPPRI